ncbi:MAG: hypothetical protein NVSMB18_19520 [Acetobacteraceae bacterium]
MADPARVSQVLGVELPPPTEWFGNSVINYQCKADCRRGLHGKRYEFRVDAAGQTPSAVRESRNFAIKYAIIEHWQILDGGGVKALGPSEIIDILPSSAECFPSSAIKEAFRDVDTSHPWSKSPGGFVNSVSAQHAPHSYQITYTEIAPGCINGLELMIDNDYSK